MWFIFISARRFYVGFALPPALRLDRYPIVPSWTA